MGEATMSERAARRREARDAWVREMERTTGKCVQPIPPAIAFDPKGGPARRNGR